MTTKRVKLDYNHLMEQIGSAVEDVSEEKPLLALGIATGLELLSAYIKNIAERAIELNDTVLIELLKDLCVLKEKGGEDNA